MATVELYALPCAIFSYSLWLSWQKFCLFARQDAGSTTRRVAALPTMIASSVVVVVVAVAVALTLPLSR
jgi:hypothetical protein